MALFKCKMCSGNLEVTEGMTVCECEYCGTKQTVPKTRDDVMSNLFNRANNLRIKCEFDKAQEIYDKIVASDPSESEAYWGIVLCKYGIEYVEDPATYKKVPTCHRTQLESVMTDVDYLAAVEHADVVQRSVYEEEARAIDKLQKDILEIVHKEQPFDVFICYKETDESGKRTNDSVIANDIYHQLTMEGFKVFYAAITLEDKLGQEYEPYIFAALNSAKVMLVIGSKPEYFNAVWVKNEWSRYMKLMKSDRSKLLIPCYKDMDAYDLPEDFSHLQAQDMSKIGFINDVIRGIKKIIVKEEAPKAPAPAQTVVAAPASANVENLLKRGMLSLEDGKWDEADKFFEQVLNENVEEPRAYFGKMLSSLKARSEEHLLQSAPTKYSPLTDNENYKKAVRFAGEEYKAYLLDLNNRYVFSSGMKCFDSAKTEEDFLASKDIFDKLPDYQPAKEKSAECIEKAHAVVYQKACTILSEGEKKTQLLFAISEFSRISDYKDSEQKKAQCEERLIQIECAEKDEIYNKAINMLASDSITDHELRTALSLFRQIIDWKDSKKYIAECQERINNINSEIERKRSNSKQEAEKQRLLEAKRVKKRKILTATIFTVVVSAITISLVFVNVILPNQKYSNAVSLMNEGKYSEAISAFEELDGYMDSADLVKDCKYNYAVSLMNNRNYSEAIPYFLNNDGYKDSRVLFVDCIKQLYPIDTIAYGFLHAVGLRTDGTVVATGVNYDGQCNVSEWKGIIAVSAGDNHSLGLKTNDTVVATGKNDFGQCNVSGWKDIKAVSAGANHTVGLKSDGTVIAIGDNSRGQCDVSGWTDIIAVSAGANHTVGLKSDGTVVLVGNDYLGQNDVSKWSDIISISIGYDHIVGLKSDGTVVAIGNPEEGKCDVQGWKDIIAVSAGERCTVGLKYDGTVVRAGSTIDKNYDISEWTDIVAISAGIHNVVGLKSDGTVISNYKSEDFDVSDWTNIKVTNG